MNNHFLLNFLSFHLWESLANHKMSYPPRYSLTLWQGKTDPVTVEDLLFIRNNSHLEQIYYDIYEPVLSKFKDVACEY